MARNRGGRCQMTGGERFLDAFAAIERLLRQKAGARREDRFSALVETAARRDPAVRRLAVDLKEYADLRNAIVHERGGGHLIAEPHESTVSRIEEIRTLLERPPQLGSLFHGPVQVADPHEPVGTAAQQMRKGDFSQLPVYEGPAFIGLLTAETVTRWLAAMLAGGVGLVEEAAVADVLPHTEDPVHHCAFLPRDATAFDALDKFDRHASHGWSLDAILLTHSGDPNQRPLAIITTFDIPTLIAAVNIRATAVV